MNLCAKTEYACIALAELALHHEQGDPVRIRALAEAHGIPSRFLVQILIQLKNAGLVASTRGAAGGYRLARPPEEITLADVVDVVEGPADAAQSNATGQTPTVVAVLDLWREAAAAQREVLARVTLAELQARVRGQAENMYYI